MNPERFILSGLYCSHATLASSWSSRSAMPLAYPRPHIKLPPALTRVSLYALPGSVCARPQSARSAARIRASASHQAPATSLEIMPVTNEDVMRMISTGGVTVLFGAVIILFPPRVLAGGTSPRKTSSGQSRDPNPRPIHATVPCPDGLDHLRLHRASTQHHRPGGAGETA
jgi:hypothetical protein